MSSALLQIHVLGETSARVSGRPIAPDATHVFATLLALGLAPGHRFTRQRLATLLWPDAPASRQAERVRWLLSKLRGLGVPIAASSADVSVAASMIELDYAVALARLHDVRAPGDAFDDIGPVLADYAPNVSAQYRRWLDERHDAMTDELLAGLGARLAQARARGEWTVTERVARAMLRIAPRHEEATLACAEALCATGDKARGLALLDEYLADLYEDKVDLRLPAELLRRRITMPAHGVAITGSALPFIGRRDSLQRFHTMLASAAAGRGGAVMFAGPAGIGKTRLMEETAAFVDNLAQTRVVSARCRPGDAARPLSGLIDLLPQLLEVPGAVGCDPLTYGRLTQLCAMEHAPGAAPAPVPVPPHAQPAEWLALGLCELLEAIGVEQTIVIQLEDFQWASRGIRWLWEAVLPQSASQRVLWVLTARADNLSAAAALVPEAARGCVAIDWLHGLQPTESQEFMERLLPAQYGHEREPVRTVLVERGGGIPLVLQELAKHWMSSGDLAHIPVTLAAMIDARIARLSPGAKRTLQVSALLGGYSALPRLERVLQLPRAAFIDAVAELESSGILTTDRAGATHNHALWAEAAAAQLELSVSRILHRHIAEDLEWEMATNATVTLLWEIAHHWGESGDTKQELAAIIGGAEHLVRNGLYAEAAEAYARAIAAAADDSQRLGFMRRRVELLRPIGAWPALEEEAEAHQRLAERIPAAHDTHNEVELLRHVAILNRPTARPAGAEELLSCVADERCDTAHRWHAAHVAVWYALQLLDRHLCERVTALTAHLSAVTPADQRHRTTCEVIRIFTMDTRDYRRGLAVCSDWVAVERERGDPFNLSVALRMYAIMSVSCGEFAECRRTALESVRVARDAHFHVLSTAAHTVLFMLAFLYEDLDTARRLLEPIEDAASRISSDRVYRITVPLQRAQLAVESGDWQEALRLLPRLENIITFWPSARQDALAALLGAQMLRPRNALSDAEMSAVAEALGDMLMGAGLHNDWPAAIYAGYIETTVGSVAANAFVGRYMSEWRLDLSPPARQLAPFLARLNREPPARIPSAFA